MCLKDCGFTTADIAAVKSQAPGSKALAKKLQADIVAKYDEAQLSTCLLAALNTTTAHGIMAVDTGAILALADYVNQYGSIGPSFIEYLNERDQTRNITVEDVQAWKLTTKYGREHKADCERRYNNILRVLDHEHITAAAGTAA
jgi:hypothetical protein